MTTHRAARARRQVRGPAMPLAGRPVEIRSADGTRLHAEVFGPHDAPPVVLAHGILCRLDFWRHQIEELSADYRVIAFDQRGHGGSAAPRVRDYTLGHLADDLAAVLAATVGHDEKAVIAGHSMGGIAVLEWAERHPEQVAERVAAVALVNSTPGEILHNVRLLQGPERLRAQRLLLARLGGRMTRMPLPRRMPLRRALLAYAATGRGADRSVSAAVDAMIGATSARGRRGYGVMLIEMTHSVGLAALTVPTLVVAGRHDRIAPLSRSQAMAAELPNVVDLIELPGGHCGPLEHPEAVNAALLELCRDAVGGKAFGVLDGLPLAP